MPGDVLTARTPPLAAAWAAASPDYVTALAMEPAGDRVAVACASGPTLVLATADGRVCRHLPGHRPGTTAVAWSPDGSLLATGGQDGTLRLWDPASGDLRAEVEAGPAWVEHLTWAPAPVRGAPCLAAAAGKTLLFWTPGEPVARVIAHASTISALAWKPPRAGGAAFPMLVSAAYGGVRFWEPGREPALEALAWKGSILALAWSPNGKYLATGDQDATVHFWILDRRRELEMSGYPTKVRELAWDAAGRHLATGGGAAVTVWDCSGRKGPEGSKPIVLEGHEGLVSAVAWQGHRTFLASGGADAQVIVWQPARGPLPLGRARVDGEVTHLAWTPGDDRLIVGSAGGIQALEAPRP